MKAGPLASPSSRQTTSRPQSAGRAPRGLTADAVRRLSRVAGNRAVARLLEPPTRRLQRGPDRPGLFTPGLRSRPVAPYKEAAKNSKKGRWEAEHMMPSAAWQASGLPHTYAQLPAMSIGYGMHRGAQAGAGGGVTSTGSSHTAKEWARRLGSQLRDPRQREAAFRSVATDEYNAALMTGVLDEGLVSQIIQTLDLHVEQGHLSVEEAGRIQNDILDRWFSSQPRETPEPRQQQPSGLDLLVLAAQSLGDL